MKFWATHALPILKSAAASSLTMHVMAKPHRMTTAIRLETQLSRIWHRSRRTRVSGTAAAGQGEWALVVRMPRALASGSRQGER